MTSTVVVGLLGGVGSGKSTVARLFAECGARVLDADRIAHDCLELPEVREELTRRFGPAAIGADGRVDRARLADVVFSDAARRRELEALIHPRVRDRIETSLDEHRARGDGGVVLLDVPLLLESPLDRLCDVRVFVDTPRAVREERVKTTRGWDTAELDRRERSQLPIETKAAAADYTIGNADSLESVRARVRALHDDLLGREARPTGGAADPRPTSNDSSEPPNEDGAKANGPGKLSS